MPIALPPPGPTNRVCLRVPPRYYQSLLELAEQRGQPIATTALELLQAALDASK